VNVAAVKSLLFLAFFLSGCSGLIYQTVWVRMLTRYLGATTHATATVLVVFMAGLALGAYLSGKVADRVKRPLIGYTLLELAIGVMGLLASVAVIEGVGGFYVQMYEWTNSKPLLLAGRVGFVLACLLLPTVLMGATLPLMVAFITRLGQHFQASLGWLYAINTYGAVVGVLVTGLFLLGELGERASLEVAAALNGAAALLALILAVRQPGPGAATGSVAAVADAEEAVEPYPAGVRRLAYVTIFVSGLTALAYEILWTRLLVLLLETSIYAFSIMLATFLLGIAWGSWDSTRRARLRRAPLAAFGMLEILIGFWAVIGLLLLPTFHGWWLHAEGRGYVLNGTAFAIGIGACFVMVLPVAFFFGLQFPVAVRCCVADAGAPGRSTGRAYTVNTVGTIVGSLLAGFLLLPLLGTTTTMLVLAGLNVLLGVLLLGVAPQRERGRLPLPAAALVGGFTVLVTLVQMVHQGDPYLAAMWARTRAEFPPDGQIYAAYEAPAATTVAAGDPHHPLRRALFVNGVGVTHLCSETKVMAHLPYHLAESPKRMLVICFGMGTTFRSAVLTYPDLHVDAVDIVPEVYDCYHYFHDNAPEVVKRPNARLHADDGRNFLLVHREPYDVITIDPAPPLHSAGSVNLYTKEFFTLCKSRLTPGGAFNMWVPHSAESEMLMIMRSFLDVFPEGTLWGALEYPGFFMIGGHRSLKQTPEQLAALADKLSRIDDLKEWNDTYAKPENLRRLYLLDAAGLAKLVAGVPPVTDDKPYTEFPLWRQYFHPKGRGSFDAYKVRARLPELMGQTPGAVGP
jgi:spermidine synthase